MINEKIKGFIESPVSHEFGLTVEQIAEKCKSYGRFSAWLNQDISRIVEVLNIVKSRGVSPAFFASYEVTEGYNSSWGWLNHTTINGTPTQDAQSVSDWIVTQSKNMSDNPSWIDYGNPVDFVPQSVKTSGNQHFQGLPSGTIGRVVIAGTAAATWEVYYPQGLLKEYNQVQDYGKPLENMMNLIIQWGGNIEGGSGGSKPLFPTTQGLPITSTYGYRGDIGVPGASHYHWAIDIGGGTTNHPIYATQDGIVTHSSVYSNGAVYIAIKHTGDPYHSHYLHLQAGSPMVQVGDVVQKGQQIARMGNTGVSSGIHLHFAVSSDGTWGSDSDPQGTIDPEIYLEMTFGSGSDGISGLEGINMLFLVDALAGWKW